jgi:serine/threonine protein kinase
MGGIAKEGPGFKQGGFVKDWKSRWLVLQGTTLTFLEKQGGKSKGRVDISTATDIALATRSECWREPSFKVTVGTGRTYYVQVKTPDEAMEWVTALSIVWPSSRNSLSADGFEFLRVIGRGVISSVHLVRSKADGQLYAMKIMKKRELKNDAERNKKGPFEQALFERNALMTAAHPFLVRGHCAFQSDLMVFLVLEYAPGGDLRQLLREGAFTEERTRLYAAQMLLAIGFLHSKGIAHRDLKPSEVLVDRDGYVRITDFGFAKTGMDSAQSTTSTFCGTPEYIAPELVQGQPYTKSVDWWSYGIIVYEMLAGVPPFLDENSNRLYRDIVSKPVEFPEHLSPRARDLIGKLLEKDPSKRLGAGSADYEEIKAHEFFAEIDWDALLKKEIEMEWKPSLREDTDVSYFDRVFTDERPGLPYEHPVEPGEELWHLPGFEFGPVALLP